MGDNGVIKQNLGSWILAISVFVSALPIHDDPFGLKEGSTVRQYVWSLVFLVSILVLLFHKKKAIQTINTIEPLFWVLLAYAGVSIAWSPYPFISFKRYFQLAGVVLIGVAACAVKSTDKDIVDIIRAPLTVLLSISWVIVWLWPDQGLDNDNAWRGFMSHKNQLGQLGLLTAIIWFFSVRLRSTPRLISVLFISMALLTVLFSHSSTNLIVILLVAAWIFLKNVSLRGLKPLLLATATVLLLVGLFAAVVVGVPSPETVTDFLFESVGRESSLTGRTHLWGLIGEEIGAHFILGTGYGGFWQGRYGMSAWLVSRLNWGPPAQAHNGYLDLLNELGLAGFLIFIAWALRYVIRLQKLRSRSEQRAQFPAVFFFALLVQNISETSILRTTHLLWIVFVASYIEAGSLLNARKVSV